MSVAQCGDLTIDSLIYTATSPVEARRTSQLIRTSDPECYQLCLSVNGDLRKEQADNRVIFRPRDLALYDLSLPKRSLHPAGPAGMRVIKLSIPKAMVPISPDVMRAHAGSLIPRRLPGYNDITQLLIELADGTGNIDEPTTAAALRDYVVQALGQWTGQSKKISPTTVQALRMALLRSIIHRRHGEAALDPKSIADAANISERLLYKNCRGAGTTPMKLLKQMRVNACCDSLRDPLAEAMSIKDVHTRHGYERSDLFARHFKKLAGVTSTKFRQQADPL
jgi:AraC-like DNA-binding protein